MSIEILNRYTKAVIYTHKGDSLTDANLTDANLMRADLFGANLTDANLMRADLFGADLTDANLTDANLTDANLTDANLTRANLTDANLTRANLTRADLTRANLTRADLTRANLTAIKADFFDILNHAPREVAGLLEYLNAGKINGSSYTGECSCLMGTLGKVAGCAWDSIPGITPDSNRPAERWFLAIQVGLTPDNHPIAAITRDWILEWQTDELNRRDRHQDMDAWARNESEG